MDKELRILILEDVPADAELEEHELRKAELVFISKVVDTRESFLKALDEFSPDLILSDYELPAFDGIAALRIAKEKSPDVPFILVSGKVGEEFAIEKLKEGATDYVLKNNLKRLAPSIKRALQEAEEIAERKRLRRELQESEKLYRLLAENTIDMITRHLPDGTYLYVSPVCRTLFGYEPEELIGTNAFEQMHPEDVKRVITITQEALRTDGSNVARYRHRTKDGQYIWVETACKIVKNKITGEIEDIICVVRDITERKLAEDAQKLEKAYFEQLFENAPEAIVVGDVEGRIVHVNADFNKLFAYTQEEASGRLIDELIIPESLRNEALSITDRVAKGERITLETTRQNKDGIQFDVSLLCQPIVIDNKVIGVYGIYRDITKRKKAEEEIKKRVKELEDFYDMAIGRELRMIELKEQMEELKEELSKYKNPQDK
ncbi:MAG: PAS domain S-box protein [Thermodesulfovibrionales bacterium]